MILGGAWLRFASLGRLSFWADEFPHAVAARSLIAGDGPSLPSGEQYRRALAHTILVAGAMRVGGQGETASRLPSALIGTASAALIWWLVRKRFGDPAGLAAAAALAVMPLHVAHSRSARFYAVFAVAYGLAAVLGSWAVRRPSKRAIVGAGVAFAVALHLQLLALMVLLPVAADGVATLIGRRDPNARRALRVGLVIGLAVIVLVLSVSALRSGIAGLLERPVPGLELAPGFRVDALARLGGLVPWWAWLALVPALVAVCRRFPRDILTLSLHLVLPALLMSMLFRPVGGGSIPMRYAFHLASFIAVLVGLAAAELARRAGTLFNHERVVPVLGAALAISSIAGVADAFRIPGARHPGLVIPRPNYDAAAATIRANGTAGDALLSTGPLAMAWTLGRCGEWLRSREAAAPFMRGDRDVYCGSALVADVPALRDYVAAHPRGWVVADPASWRSHVAADVRSAVEEIATPVPVDGSVLVYRWDETR